MKYQEIRLYAQISSIQTIKAIFKSKYSQKSLIRKYEECVFVEQSYERISDFDGANLDIFKVLCVRIDKQIFRSHEYFILFCHMNIFQKGNKPIITNFYDNLFIF